MAPWRWDLGWTAPPRAVEGSRGQFSKMAAKGRLTAAEATAASARLVPVAELAELAGCALVLAWGCLLAPFQSAASGALPASEWSTLERSTLALAGAGLAAAASPC